MVGRAFVVKGESNSWREKVGHGGRDQVVVVMVVVVEKWLVAVGEDRSWWERAGRGERGQVRVTDLSPYLPTVWTPEMYSSTTSIKRRSSRH